MNTPAKQRQIRTFKRNTKLKRSQVRSAIQEVMKTRRSAARPAQV